MIGEDRNFVPKAVGKIIAAVFLGEFLVMVTLYSVTNQLSLIQEAVLDAVLLSAMCSVVLWIVLVKPMRARTIAEMDKFNRLMEAVPDGVIGVDEQGRIRLLNKRIEDLFQYRRSDLIGKSVELLIPNRYLKSHKRRRGEFFAASGLANIGVAQELIGRRANGSEVPIEVSLNRIRTPQGLLALGSVRDVSNQKLAHEALLEANGRLNAGLSDLERSSEELRRLSELGELLQGCVTEQEAHTIISRLLARQLPRISGGMYLISASRNVLQLRSSWGDEAGTLVPIFAVDECWALRRGRLHAAQDNQSTIQCHHINPQHDGYLCIPLMAQGDLLGILHVFVPSHDSSGSRVENNTNLDSKRTLLFAVAEQISMALANLRLREELKKQSIRDSLTGLYNRRFMEESFDREMLRASTMGDDLSLVMIDLDHFKHFNDTFGHEGGDLVLREIGALLRKKRCGSCIAGRLGGEELALIFPETSIDKAAKFAETFRQHIEDLAVLLGGRPLGKITASFGVASYPRHGKDYEHIARAADVALYQAKAQGRNRVVVANDPEKTSDSSVDEVDDELRMSANDAG